MYNHLYDIFNKWSCNDGEHKNSIWLYSDPHFADLEMPHIRKNYIGDDEQVKRINSKVGKKDTIIFLGDIGDLEFIKKIRGYKVLIMGNHEKGASNYKRVVEEIETFNSEELSDKDRKLLTASIEKILQTPESTINISKYFHKKVKDNHLFDEVYEGCLMISDKIILSHEPITNLPEFMFNIHGHDHSNWFTGSHHLNLCAEHINYTPVSLNSIIKDGLLKDVESIHRLTIDNAIDRKNKREAKKSKLGE